MNLINIPSHLNSYVKGSIFVVLSYVKLYGTYMRITAACYSTQN